MPTIEYARTADGFNIAYQILGDGGGADVVMVSGAFFPMEVLPEDRLASRLLEGLVELGRLVMFDKRGVGLSDPYTDWERPVTDQWAEDLLAVIDAAQLERPVVFAWDQFGVARAAAGRRHDAFGGLVLLNPVSTFDVANAEEVASGLERNAEGLESDIERLVVPSRIDDPSFVDWIRRAGRLGASPATAQRLWREVWTREPETPTDLGIPTLVLHRSGSIQPRESSAAVAEAIEGARFVELPGEDVMPFAGDVDALLAEIGSFVLGTEHVPLLDRVLAAVLFTDLVDSTEQAADLGDQRWRSLLDRHDGIVRQIVARHGGRVVKYMGDGVLAVLPSASGALEAATVIRDRLAADHLQMRAGVHVGEVDERGDDVSGLAVNIAARIMAEARPGEVLASDSARLATAGTAFDFGDGREVELKGLPGSWAVQGLSD